MIDLAQLTHLADEIAARPQPYAIHVTAAVYDTIKGHLLTDLTMSGVTVHSYDVDGQRILFSRDRRRLSVGAFRYFCEHPEAVPRWDETLIGRAT